MSRTRRAKRIEIAGVGAVETLSADDARLGPLIGLAVGDALGTTYEFARIEQPPYPALATGPATDVVGGGPFRLAPGQITDDTQLAICLARTLHGATALGDRSALDLDDLARRYLAWFQHAFDVGGQTARALTRIERGTPPARAGRDVWHESGRRAAGNGSLMRTAPIGVAFASAIAGADDDSAIASALGAMIDAAIADSLATHADPRCVLACAAFDAAIASGVSSLDDGPIESAAAPMLRAARLAIAAAADRLERLWHDDPEDAARVATAKTDLLADLDAARGDDPGVYGHELDVNRTAGFVRVAFRLAFWHVARTPWRDAVVDVASRGGDADTNAAIVGALLGARDGACAIPEPWVARVLGATQPGPDDWAAAHHPRHLVALAAQLRAASDAAR